MIFNLFDSCWKQMTLVHSLKILFNLKRRKKKEKKKKILKGANSTSEFRQFSKISFPITFPHFHTHFFVFCRDAIVTSRIWKLGHCSFYYLKRFLLFNSIRPFIDKGKYDFKEYITTAVFSWSLYLPCSLNGEFCAG